MTEEFKRPKPPAPPSPSWGAPDPPPNRDRDAGSLWTDLVRFTRDAEGFWETVLAGFGILWGIVFAPFVGLGMLLGSPFWVVGRLARRAFRSTRKVGLPDIPGVPPIPPARSQSVAINNSAAYRCDCGFPPLVPRPDPRSAAQKMRDARAEARDIGNIPRPEGAAPLDIKPPPVPRSPFPVNYVDGGICECGPSANAPVNFAFWPPRCMTCGGAVKPPPDMAPPAFATCRDAVRECINAITAAGTKQPDGSFRQWFGQGFVRALREVLARQDGPTTPAVCMGCTEPQRAYCFNHWASAQDNCDKLRPAPRFPTLGQELEAKEPDLRNNTRGGVPLRDLRANRDTAPRE